MACLKRFLNFTESIAIMELVILALFSAWLMGMVHRGEIRLIRAPIGLPLLLAALHLLPLPLDLTKGLLPEFFHPPPRIESEAGPSYRPFSLYPLDQVQGRLYATQAFLLLGLAYVAVFLLVLHRIQTRHQLKQFRNVLVVMSSSQILTLSRGGILSLLFALVFFGTTRALVQTEGRWARLYSLVLALVLGSFVWMGIGPVLVRFSEVTQTRSYLDRKQVSQDSLVRALLGFPPARDRGGDFRARLPSL